MAKILIVEARFYEHLNDLLLEGARAAIEAGGHEHETITVPGALEIPGAVALAADSGAYDGFVALGVVIRGETYHFEIVAGESARGLMALSMDGLAIGNGILTTEDEAQALTRARKDEKDKGGEAAQGGARDDGAEGALRLSVQRMMSESDPVHRTPGTRSSTARRSDARHHCTRWAQIRRRCGISAGSQPPRGRMAPALHDAGRVADPRVTCDVRAAIESVPRPLGRGGSARGG